MLYALLEVIFKIECLYTFLSKFSFLFKLRNKFFYMVGMVSRPLRGSCKHDARKLATIRLITLSLFRELASITKWFPGGEFEKGENWCLWCFRFWMIVKRLLYVLLCSDHESRQSQAKPRPLWETKKTYNPYFASLRASCLHDPRRGFYEPNNAQW